MQSEVNKVQSWSNIGCIGMAQLSFIGFFNPKEVEIAIRRSANFSKSKLKVCTYRAEIIYVGIFKSIHGLT